MAHPGDAWFYDLPKSQQREIARGWGDARPDEAAVVFNGMTPRDRWEVRCTLMGRSGQSERDAARIAANADPKTIEVFERMTQESQDGDPPRLALVAASTVHMEETLWAWKDRIPLGGVTLLAGQEGSGKTTILADVLARATRGMLEGDLMGHAVGCVYATAEDSWSRTLAPRLTAAGADLDRIYFIQVDGLSGGLTIPGDLLDLATQMEATRSRLLVLDPLGAHLGATLDTHRDAAVRQALAPLASHMDTMSAACVGIVHWSKAPTTVALDRVNGSRAFTAACRSMLAVGEDPDDETSRVLILAKSNLGRLDVPALRYRVEGRSVPIGAGEEIATSGIAWLGEAPGVGTGDIFNTSDPGERTTNEEIGDYIREILAEGPVERKLVLMRLRSSGYIVSDKTFQKICTKLGIVRQKAGFAGPNRLALPGMQYGHTGPNSHANLQDAQYVQNGCDQGFTEKFPAHNAHSGHSGLLDMT
jgi:hypothetical protein